MVIGGSHRGLICDRNKGPIFQLIAQAWHRNLRSDSFLVHTGYIDTGALLVLGFGTQPYVQPTNLQQLRDANMSIWPKIFEECFQHLVESMPQRIKAVLKAKGGPTRY